MQSVRMRLSRWVPMSNIFLHRFNSLACRHIVLSFQCEPISLSVQSNRIEITIAKKKQYTIRFDKTARNLATSNRPTFSDLLRSRIQISLNLQYPVASDKLMSTIICRWIEWRHRFYRVDECVCTVASRAHGESREPIDARHYNRRIWMNYLDISKPFICTRVLCTPLSEQN